MRDAKFSMGLLAATPGALDALAESGQNAFEFLQRHAAGDWGDMCSEDRVLNDDALENGGRLFSAYCTESGTRLWIITEADRSATTLLLPEEY